MSNFYDNTLSFLSDAAFWLIGALLVLVVLKWKVLDSIQKRVAIIVLLTFLNHALTWYLMLIQKWNLWVFHLYTPLMFVLVLRVYKKAMIGKIKPVVFNGLSLAFVLFAIVNGLLFQSVNEFNSNTIWISGVVFVVLALLYLYFQIGDASERSNLSKPIFWFNCGILVYYTTTMVLFYVVDAVFTIRGQITIDSWILNAFFNMLLIISYGVALSLKPWK